MEDLIHEAYEILLEKHFQEKLFFDRGIKDEGKEYKALCPFHDDNHPSLSIAKDKPVWLCFGCGESGNWISYLEKKEGIDWKDARKFLIEKAGLKFDESEYDEKKWMRRNLLKTVYWFFREQLWTKQGEEAVRYLTEKRGYSAEEIKGTDLGYYPGYYKTLDYLLDRGYSEEFINGETGLKWLKSKNGNLLREEYKIVIPYRDPQGEIIGLYGRLIKNRDNEGKYMPFTDASGLRNTLFNFHMVRENGDLILVEGYLDALTSTQKGFEEVVAVGQGSLREAQLEHAIEYGINSFILAFDNDPAGEQATDKAIDLITQKGKRVYVVTFPRGYKDPDELIHGNKEKGLEAKGIEAFKKLVNEASSGVEWKAQYIFDNHDINSPKGKDDALDELIEYEESIELSKDRERVKEIIKEEIGIKDGELNELIEEYHEKKKNETVNPRKLYFKRNKFVPKLLGDDIMKDYFFATMDDTEEIYVYQDGIYRSNGEKVIKEEAKTRLGDYFKTYYINEALSYIKFSTYKQRSDFNKSENQIAVENGLLDIVKMKLWDHTPKELLTIKLPVKYNQNVDCPKIREFMREVMKKKDVKVIQEFVGYCLYKDYLFHKGLMLLGDGANGKSTLLNLIRNLLGEENVAGPSLQNLVDNRFATAGLYGKLASIHADIPNKILRETGTFKMLTGGDSIRAEKKYRNEFYFYNNAKLMFSANELPQTKDRTEAFYRRWIIINFPHKFTKDPNDGHKKRDPHLLEKLTTEDELSGMLNWVLEGLHRLLEKGGFSYDKTSEEISELYESASNIIKAFVDECLEIDIEGYVRKDEVYAIYREYMKEKGVPIKAKNIFSREIQKVAPIKNYRPRESGGRIECWKGIRMKENGEDGLGGQGSSKELFLKVHKK